MHVGIAYLLWRGKRSRHSRRMRTRNFAYLARGPWNWPCRTNRMKIWTQCGEMIEIATLHCWPRVRNNFFLSTNFGIFVGLVQFYVFLEIFSAFVGWYGEIFWFNPNMQNSTFWLTLTLPSSYSVRIMLTTQSSQSRQPINCRTNSPQKKAVRRYRDLFNNIFPLAMSSLNTVN